MAGQDRKPRKQIKCQEGPARDVDAPCTAALSEQAACSDTEHQEHRGRSLYLSGRPACLFKEPRVWFLQTVFLKVVHRCERCYMEASDTDPSKRRWLAVWRTMKALFDALLTEDDDALEEMGKTASEVLRYVTNRHAAGLGAFQPIDGWPGGVRLEGIGLECGYQFGDVPFIANMRRHDAVRLLINTLRMHVLELESGSWKHAQPARLEPSMTPEKFANMAPSWAAIVHEGTVAEPGKPLKHLVQKDRARVFAATPEPEVRLALEKAFARWRRDVLPQQVIDDDAPIEKLAKAMLKALGASNDAVQKLFRDPADHSEDMDTRRDDRAVG